MLKITHPYTIILDNIVHTHPNAKNWSYAKHMSPRALMCMASDLVILFIFKLSVIKNTRQSTTIRYFLKLCNKFTTVNNKIHWDWKK